MASTTIPAPFESGFNCGKKVMYEAGEWLSVSANIKSKISTAGFVDAVGEMAMVPTGGWHPDSNLKEVGMCMLKHWVEGAEGITLDMFTRILGWKKTNVDELLAKIRKDLLNPKIRTFTTAWLIHARKPLAVKLSYEGTNTSRRSQHSQLILRAIFSLSSELSVRLWAWSRI